MLGTTTGRAGEVARGEEDADDARGLPLLVGGTLRLPKWADWVCRGGYPGGAPGGGAYC